MNPVDAPISLKPHRGGMLLAFGILGLLCCVIFGIVAWVMGSGDLKEMEAGRMDPSGEGLTKAGKILGIVGCVLNVIGIIGWILLVVFSVAVGGLQHGLS